MIYERLDTLALCRVVSSAMVLHQYTLCSKGGKASVVSLVLSGVVGGGDHLPSGDPYARLSVAVNATGCGFYSDLKKLNICAALSSAPQHAIFQNSAENRT